MASEKGFSKPLFEGASWTDAGKELEKEVRRLPENR
jgi:hypothetical protein